MTGTAASSGPGPTGTDNDCSESESEGWRQTSQMVIWEEEDKKKTEQSLFDFICSIKQRESFVLPEGCA